ncbi:MAG: hypothetical protein IJ683_14375 [Butyrivibrio sp.]|nr:hypothetical protein [Butyrivibrio sp.]MBR1643495.1 hypothetical protein [Butyrivibrio sp.]
MVIALTVWDIIKMYIGFFLGEDTIAGQINAIMSLFTGNNSGGVSLASLLIEVMAFINYASILYATGMIKKLKKAREEAQ